MSSLLVTATDTAVGKTIITAALARAWRAAGRDVGVMKPVASGGMRDTQIIRAAAATDDPEDLITPLSFEAPLAPNVAARLEKRDVNLATTTRAFADLKGRHDWLLVEGLGGALAPMTDDIAVADWAAAARLPALVVARTDLGTLNHTRMTLEVLADRGVPIVGVILNRLHGGEPDLAERTNPEALARLIDTPIWGPVPFTGGLGEEEPVKTVVDRLPGLPFAEEVAERLTEVSR